jgi:hypothetical protein
MLRTPEFKYARYDDGGSELYDLTRDPDELENRADDSAYAGRVGELKALVARWEREYPHRG